MSYPSTPNQRKSNRVHKSTMMTTSGDGKEQNHLSNLTTTKKKDIPPLSAREEDEIKGPSLNASPLPSPTALYVAGEVLGEEEMACIRDDPAASSGGTTPSAKKNFAWNDEKDLFLLKDR
jgi:hypothetical protein